ncbi:MAG: EF2563 family selenium-dependent molybdenum hydroxylase system protein [Desulfovibrionales bacterium]|nr:EF2563 family selenium-dependent molybdenum hydroxylase system protein [Desulfovibrionales bacterium]
MGTRSLNNLVVAIKSGGEMGSAVAWTLFQAGLRRILILETARPLAVRRTISFCEAVYDGTSVVEQVPGQLVANVHEATLLWEQGQIPILVDPTWASLGTLTPHVVVDAIIAKRNLGTSMTEAPLVIGMGPGFKAGQDVHVVVETQRGQDLGQIITTGEARPNTGIPGDTGGFTKERVLRAPVDGPLTWACALGDMVTKGQILGHVAGAAIVAEISGLLRGQIRPHGVVPRGLKLGDIDPRGDTRFLHIISDKGRALGNAVLKVIMEFSS